MAIASSSSQSWTIDLKDVGVAAPRDLREEVSGDDRTAVVDARVPQDRLGSGDDVSRSNRMPRSRRVLREERTRARCRFLRRRRRPFRSVLKSYAARSSRSPVPSATSSASSKIALSSGRFRAPLPTALVPLQRPERVLAVSHGVSRDRPTSARRAARPDEPHLSRATIRDVATERLAQRGQRGNGGRRTRGGSRGSPAREADGSSARRIRLARFEARSSAVRSLVREQDRVTRARPPRRSSASLRNPSASCTRSAASTAVTVLTEGGAPAGMHHRGEGG